MLKPYVVVHRASTGCWCGQDETFFGYVVANCESEAITLCLESEPDTKASEWIVEEIEVGNESYFWGVC